MEAKDTSQGKVARALGIQQEECADLQKHINIVWSEYQMLLTSVDEQIPNTKAKLKKGYDLKINLVTKISIFEFVLKLL